MYWVSAGASAALCGYDCGRAAAVCCGIKENTEKGKE